MQVSLQNKFRWRVSHGAPLIVTFLFLVASFVRGADLTWPVNTGVEWSMALHPYPCATYRQFETDVEDDDFHYDIKQSGPQLEFGLRL